MISQRVKIDLNCVKIDLNCVSIIIAKQSVTSQYNRNHGNTDTASSDEILALCENQAQVLEKWYSYMKFYMKI